jgi:AraC family transcriptional regulator
MKPNIVKKPAFTVVGMKYRGKNEHNEIPQLWAKFGPHMHEIQHLVHPDLAYGVMGNYDEKTGEFDYIAACQVDQATNVAEGMCTEYVPAQTYAVFSCTLATIGQTYEMIRQEWLPTSGYHQTTGPDFELYDEQFDPGNVNSVMYLYIPVEPVR